MSKSLQAGQYASQKGVVAEGHVQNEAILCEGTAVPVNGLGGYEEGCVFIKRGGAAGAAFYINEGTSTSCLFVPLLSNALGQRVVGGQFTTVTASDTVVTGLTTVISAVANLDAGPAVDPEIAIASIGNQTTTPVAGSILITTWKTLGGTPVASATFGAKVNWIAVGK